jgi:uncharacterized protein (TIGR00255 family)
MKSVNHRFLEICVRLPRQYSSLEEPVKGVLQEELIRGRLDVFISIERTEEGSSSVKVDKALSLAYYNALKELAGILGISSQLSVVDLAGLPGVFSMDTSVSAEEVWPAVKDALIKAKGELLAMREREGRRMAADMIQRLEKLAFLKDEIKEREPHIVPAYRQRLESRLQELLPQVEINEDRLLAELIIIAERSDIAEELVRLNSHIIEFQRSLEQEQGSVGRRLDFLLQELFREINTIGSKSADLIISQKVVESKSEVEKLREQVQNIV